jgi:hypothetical protein
MHEEGNHYRKCSIALMAGPALAQRDRGDDDRADGISKILFRRRHRRLRRPSTINSLDDVDDVGIDFSDSDNALKVRRLNFNRYFALQDITPTSASRAVSLRCR